MLWRRSLIARRWGDTEMCANHHKATLANARILLIYILSTGRVKRVSRDLGTREALVLAGTDAFLPAGSAI